MKPTRPVLRTLVCLALLSLAGCSQATRLQGRIEGIRDIVEQAERNGAYRCAPRELATAKAKLDFADTELAQGDPYRAEEHFMLAEPNARAALRLSPPERCAPRGRRDPASPAPGRSGRRRHPRPR